MKVISMFIAILLIIAGVFLIVDYSGRILFTNFLSTGILAVILGAILLIYPNTLSILIPIIVGIWMIVNSIVNIQLSLVLKKVDYTYGFLSVILSIIVIICGIIMILNPHTGSLALTTLFGIILIVYSLSDMIDIIIFKNNVNDIVKLLKD